ncbi:MAG TPA: hypothetical protein VFP12_05150 [Allosphingosinicella sp.]|nr:hypothetical protein [Allosphingosinicella sp.]
MRLTANSLIAVMGIFATILTGWIGARATYDVNDRGSVPPKRLEANYFGATDPLRDLRDANTDLRISIRHNSSEVNNLRIAQATLKNTGKAPVIPSDMIEPLALTTARPWKIVAVSNSNTAITQIKLSWRKVNDQEFVSLPTLLNPGDSIWVTAYLTADELNKESLPDVKWKARIVNLKSIEVEPSFSDKISLATLPFVNLSFPAALFALVAFTTYFILTFLLLEKAGLLRMRKRRRYAYLTGATVLNLCAAEAGATYVFGLPSIIPLPVEHWSNGPPLVLNALMVGLLSVSWLRRNRTRARATDRESD